MSLNARIEPQVYYINYLDYNGCPKRNYVNYNRISIQYKLTYLKELLELLHEIILNLEVAKKISGVHDKVYNFILYKRSKDRRNIRGFSLKEYGLYEFRNMVNTWINFFTSHLDGVYIEMDSVIELEKICESNFNRIKYTIKQYNEFVQRLFLEQKKVNKYKMLRWIQKHTVGKGYTPSFIKINYELVPEIKYKWDRS